MKETDPVSEIYLNKTSRRLTMSKTEVMFIIVSKLGRLAVQFKSSVHRPSSLLLAACGKLIIRLDDTKWQFFRLKNINNWSCTAFASSSMQTVSGSYYSPPQHALLCDSVSWLKNRSLPLH
jgi:hypothetical protein